MRYAYGWLCEQGDQQSYEALRQYDEAKRDAYEKEDGRGPRP
jgi:hypothetical protein